MAERLELRTSSGDLGKRFDVVLAGLLERSRSACAALIREGHATLDGRVVKPSHVIEREGTILVSAPPPRDLSVAPQALPIKIVYDDEEFCVVDKPAGMATHPARGTPDGTLVNALLARFPSLPAINGVRRPGIVHRLDKDTSGLLVVAKSERAMTALTRAMSGRRIKRSYDAVVWGIPQNARGAIDASIGRDPQERTKFTVREDGRRAVTHYRTIETFANIGQASREAPSGAALLRLELETGRTHQIRVHASAIGHPIVGDETYGLVLPGVEMRRQALHAAELSFAHPRTGEALHFSAPWPDDFHLLVERLRAGGRP